MNCAYHSHNGATVSCNGCGKPLCPACDHRIKGFPYCQDCIVLGVDLLRNHYQSSGSSQLKAQTSPFAALILSFICPGLGAAYNGQTHKALIHFAISVGLFQMAINLHMPLLAFAVLGMWLYSAVDAWKTARLIRSGAKPDLAEDLLVQRFSGNPKLWGILLTILGGTFLLRMLLGDRFSNLMGVLLPFFLIGLGLYILRNYIFKPKAAAGDFDDFSRRPGAPSFISAMSDAQYRSENRDADNEFPTRVRAKSWKNR
ncbi:MAG: B-box zinc finger protein [Acidobacteria bacterium]|nr:B-box zinc finger protein [Acidobacteriota bacterium]